MAKTTKPTKQQVAQAKARAGGNNPVKVTNAGLKKLGGAALIAASMTPAGRGAKIAVTAAKAVKATKTAKAVNATKSSRQAGDYAVKGSSAKSTISNAGKADAPYRYGKDAQISGNVSIKNATSPSGKQSIRGGSAQVMNQNARLNAPLSKAEAKANARGLKAANSGSKSPKGYKEGPRTKALRILTKGGLNPAGGAKNQLGKTKK